MRAVPSVVSVLALVAGASVAAADVRVVHASPDAPNVDVFVNGTPGIDMPAISNLAFTQATPYIALPTAMYNFQVTPTGAPAPVVINANAMIDANTDYTIAAIGFLSGIQPLVLVDDNTINPGAARVRFVHASPDVPTVDIFAAGGVNPLFDAVSFGTSGGYIEVPAGSYDLEVRLDAGGATALSVPGVGLSAGTVYTIWAMGSLQGGNVQAVVTVDAVPAPGAAALAAMGGLVAMRRRRRA
ncbi:MAG: DUF4397 domain-containing protein [Planctomycetota bacterium]|nr:DUF4397 domain-containing protein [Planctomycetota bacterium]